MTDTPEGRQVGNSRRFHATPWEDVKAAAEGNRGRREQALTRLIQMYWMPVYSFLVRQGRGHYQAEALTQAFFCEIVLDGKLLVSADQSRGRFRNLLLTALRRFCAMEYRRTQRKSRRPEGALFSIACDQVNLPADGNATPEEAFTRAWAVELVRRVIDDVESGCRSDGLETHWEVFRRCVVEPALSSIAAPPLADVCAELGIDHTRRASNMRITVQRRFQAALRRHVRGLVTEESLVDDEIRELMDVLAGPRAQR